VLGSNGKESLCIAILISTSKNNFSYYFSCLLFKKNGEKGRTGSDWKQGAGTEMGQGIGGRNGPNNVCTYE
jgi:hypothetical protein